MIDGQSDGRVQRGDSTRRAILRRAADIASVEGLDGLSIGRLATDLAISKSGVFAHFGSKEELQLATIRAATAIFTEAVVDPAMAEQAGVRRVRALVNGWLKYSAGRVFPGGCFFAAVTGGSGAREGRVRDALAEAGTRWTALLVTAVAEAREFGQFGQDTDPAQLAFELDAFAHAANTASVLHGDGDAYIKASLAVMNRISAASPSPLI
ncbi:TetR/AcrR family transcriptional regulator [Kutzneria viridogrisea]|uniref:TetR family transcription regulator n=2 Tax=Kutzneria TaxID=43356 RepID=W5VZV8_9PSEU|nr:TetR/AcrR family transcriptional regulator [Kutzneria albida]AHH94035.1 TetR family transcription regulator [Kutzneria albida DSM 43870]MBA8930959.1 AcrR family transcriptional regulator [Kutzneria viridogrisea]